MNSLFELAIKMTIGKYQEYMQYLCDILKRALLI